MSERKLVPQSGQRSKPSRSLANRLQPITPSQRIGLFNSERIRCAHGPASTKTNYHGKTHIADGTANGGTSEPCCRGPCRHTAIAQPRIVRATPPAFALSQSKERL